MGSGIELFRFAFLRVTLLDILDIVAISFVLYHLYLFIRGSRATQMAIGLVVIFIVSILAQLLNMSGMSWIAQKLETIWLIAFVVIFHPELRRLLLYLGQSPLIRFFVKVTGSRAVEEIIKAVKELSRQKYGALIVVVRNQGIKSVIETGIKLQAEVTAPLLISLFSPKSPLHDGAMIIDNEEIVAAKAILPLSQAEPLDKRLGTRHRAALGLAEESDAIIIIVSEETGNISIAKDANLILNLTVEEAQRILTASLNVSPEE